MDIDDYRMCIEYEYVMAMSEQMREYQLAGIDVSTIDVYRDLMKQYHSDPDIDLEHDAEEFKPILNALKRERGWPKQ